MLSSSQPCLFFFFFFNHLDFSSADSNHNALNIVLQQNYLQNLLTQIQLKPENVVSQFEETRRQLVNLNMIRLDENELFA